MSDDFGMIEAVLLRVPDGHGVRGCGQVVGLGFLVCHRHDQAWSVNHVFWKNVLWSRRISEEWNALFPCDRAPRCLPTIRGWVLGLQSTSQQQNWEGLQSNNCHLCSLVEIVLRTLFCMACRLGGLCWSCIREIWAVNILTHFKSPEHRLWARCGFQSAFQIKMDKDG